MLNASPSSPVPQLWMCGSFTGVLKRAVLIREGMEVMGGSRASGVGETDLSAVPAAGASVRSTNATSVFLSWETSVSDVAALCGVENPSCLGVAMRSTPACAKCDARNNLSKILKCGPKGKLMH